MRPTFRVTDTVTFSLRLPPRFPRRADVDDCNAKRLAELPGKQHIFSAMDTTGFDVNGFPVPPSEAKELLERLVAVSTLSLKVPRLFLYFYLI